MVSQFKIQQKMVLFAFIQVFGSVVFAQSFISQVQANMVGRPQTQEKVKVELKLNDEMKKSSVPAVAAKGPFCGKISEAGMQKIKDESGYDLVNFVESNINNFHREILPLVMQNDKSQNTKILENVAKYFDHHAWYQANLKNLKDDVSHQLLDDDTALKTNKDAIQLDADLGLYFLRNTYLSFARIYEQQELDALKEASVEQVDKDRIKAQPLPVVIRKAQITECTVMEQRNIGCQLGEKLYNLTAQVSQDLTCGKYGDEYKQKAQAIYVVRITDGGPKIANVIIPKSEIGQVDMAQMVRSNISGFENRKEFGRKSSEADARESLKSKMNISPADLDLWKKQNDFQGTLVTSAPTVGSTQREGVK